MEEFISKIKVPDGLSFENVMEERANGGRFIFFQYIISRPLFPPVRRISKIYFLRNGDKVSRYAQKYNLLSLFLGLWGLPFGPPHVWLSIVKNRTGIDVTNDVYENLTKDDFENHRVMIKKIEDVFIHPSKSSLKELKKCFRKFELQYSKFSQNPIVGYYIDTEKPYYVVGLNKVDIDKAELLTKALHKFFYKSTDFKFVDANEEEELVKKLHVQGISVDCN